MGLVANSSELSLFDFIQVKGQSPGRCSVMVKGARGEGLLCVSDGDVVYASYAGQEGEPAAHAMLSERSVSYRSSSSRSLPPSNLRIHHRKLLMDVAVLVDEARRDGVEAHGPPPEAPVPTGEMALFPLTGDPGRAARRRRTILLVVAAVVLAVAGVAGSRLLDGHGSAAGSTVAPSPAAPGIPTNPVEVSSLTGPKDAPPVLLTGDPPRSPVPDSALRPTVILRLLVDEAGRVAQAEVYQPRDGFGEFEAAAVAAARRFTFRPARRDGQPVPVWMNWPVDFI